MSFRNLLLYFENAAGTIREHPDGYAVVCYHTGSRQAPDLAVLLTQASRLLRAREWNCLLSDQRLMKPYTVAEQEWVTAFWNNQQVNCADTLRMAVLVTPVTRLGNEPY